MNTVSVYYVGGSNVVVISEDDADNDILVVSLKPWLQLPFWVYVQFQSNGILELLIICYTRYFFLCDSTL